MWKRRVVTWPLISLSKIVKGGASRKCRPEVHLAPKPLENLALKLQDGSSGEAKKSEKNGRKAAVPQKQVLYIFDFDVFLHRNTTSDVTMRYSHLGNLGRCFVAWKLRAASGHARFFNKIGYCQSIAWCRRGEERRGEERKGEERRGEERRGEDIKNQCAIVICHMQKSKSKDKVGCCANARSVLCDFGL